MNPSPTHPDSEPKPVLTLPEVGSRWWLKYGRDIYQLVVISNHPGKIIYAQTRMLGGDPDLGECTLGMWHFTLQRIGMVAIPSPVLGAGEKLCGVCNGYQFTMSKDLETEICWVCLGTGKVPA